MGPTMTQTQAFLVPSNTPRWSKPVERSELRIHSVRLRHTGERPCTTRRASSSVEEQSTIVESGAEEQWLESRPVNHTLPAGLLSSQEVVDNLYAVVHDRAQEHHHAFFSSEFGGVTTDPAFMVVHMDDHFVHRGHGVFDTAILVEGKLYMLDRHLQRFATSAEKAGLSLPCSIQQIERLILETAAYSKQRNGFVRWWLGGGRGGFGVSPRECPRSSFYCLVTTLEEGAPLRNPGSDYLRGRKVKTSPVPIKDPFFATLKSNNYLANVLTVIDAERDGFDYGIFVDAEGNICEGANMNVAILTQQGELLIPPFTNSLAGVTAQRLMELIPQHLDSIVEDTEGALQSVHQRSFTKWDVYNCKEAMLIGSTTYVTGIIQWDRKLLGDGVGGTPGIVSLVLRRLLKNDLDYMKSPRENFTEVPYGILTNMEEY